MCRVGRIRGCGTNGNVGSNNRGLSFARSFFAATEDGAALRQNAPLAGILSPLERGRIMREFSHGVRQLEHIS